MRGVKYLVLFVFIQYSTLVSGKQLGTFKGEVIEYHISSYSMSESTPVDSIEIDIEVDIDQGLTVKSTTGISYIQVPKELLKGQAAVIGSDGSDLFISELQECWEARWDERGFWSQKMLEEGVDERRFWSQKMLEEVLHSPIEAFLALIPLFQKRPYLSRIVVISIPIVSISQWAIKRVIKSGLLTEKTESKRNKEPDKRIGVYIKQKDADRFIAAIEQITNKEAIWFGCCP